VRASSFSRACDTWRAEELERAVGCGEYYGNQD
jgi:hypothetical protein